MFLFLFVVLLYVTPTSSSIIFITDKHDYIGIIFNNNEFLFVYSCIYWKLNQR